MKTNDLKKGMRVLLRNGWYATIMDNKRGNSRLAEVEGIVTEIGSVYAHDIVKVRKDEGIWENVEHTEKQLGVRRMVGKLFGA